MTKYTNEKKEHALRQMSAPHNKPMAEVAQLTGVPEATPYLARTVNAALSYFFWTHHVTATDAWRMINSSSWPVSSVQSNLGSLPSTP